MCQTLPVCQILWKRNKSQKKTQMGKTLFFHVYFFFAYFGGSRYIYIYIYIKYIIIYIYIYTYYIYYVYICEKWTWHASCALHCISTWLRCESIGALLKDREAVGGTYLPVRTVQKGRAIALGLGGLSLAGVVGSTISSIWSTSVWNCYFDLVAWGPPSVSLELTIRCQCVRECHPFHTGSGAVVLRCWQCSERAGDPGSSWWCQEMMHFLLYLLMQRMDLWFPLPNCLGRPFLDSSQESPMSRSMWRS